LQFAPLRHREFIDNTVRRLLNQLCGVMALAVEKVLPSVIIARFQPCWLLCEVNSERAKNYGTSFLDVPIADKLEQTFPGQKFYSSAFEIRSLTEIEEEP
jgi:hypothetical protein